MGICAPFSLTEKIELKTSSIQITYSNEDHFNKGGYTGWLLVSTARALYDSNRIRPDR